MKNGIQCYAAERFQVRFEWAPLPKGECDCGEGESRRLSCIVAAMQTLSDLFQPSPGQRMEVSKIVELWCDYSHQASPAILVEGVVPSAKPWCVNNRRREYAAAIARRLALYCAGNGDAPLRIISQVRGEGAEMEAVRSPGKSLMYDDSFSFAVIPTQLELCALEVVNSVPFDYELVTAWARDQGLKFDGVEIGGMWVQAPQRRFKPKQLKWLSLELAPAERSSRVFVPSEESIAASSQEFALSYLSKCGAQQGILCLEGQESKLHKEQDNWRSTPSRPVLTFELELVLRKYWFDPEPNNTALLAVQRWMDKASRKWEIEISALAREVTCLSPGVSSILIPSSGMRLSIRLAGPEGTVLLTGHQEMLAEDCVQNVWKDLTLTAPELFRCVLAQTGSRLWYLGD